MGEPLPGERYSEQSKDVQHGAPSLADARSSGIARLHQAAAAANRTGRSSGLVKLIGRENPGAPALFGPVSTDVKDSGARVATNCHYFRVGPSATLSRCYYWPRPYCASPVLTLSGGSKRHERPILDASKASSAGYRNFFLLRKQSLDDYETRLIRFLP